MSHPSYPFIRSNLILLKPVRNKKAHTHTRTHTFWLLNPLQTLTCLGASYDFKMSAVYGQLHWSNQRPLPAFRDSFLRICLKWRQAKHFEVTSSCWTAANSAGWNSTSYAILACFLNARHDQSKIPRLPAKRLDHWWMRAFRSDYLQRQVPTDLFVWLCMFEELMKEV